MPEGDHTAVIARRLGGDAPALAPGPIVTRGGEVLGEHRGFARYTVGQRRGLPGGGREPLYVLAIRPHDRALVVGPRAELLGRRVVAREINWLATAPVRGAQVQAQVRHRAPAVPADVVRVAGDGGPAGEVELALHVAVTAIAPGQSLAIYDGDRLIGGGVIETSS